MRAKNRDGLVGRMKSENRFAGIDIIFVLL